MKTNKYLKNIAIGFIALQFIVFGLNKFIGFVNPPPPADPTAQAFLGAMFGSYLAKWVGFVEIIGSILLIIPRTRLMGVLVLIPVMVNIVLFHLAHDNPGNGIWILVSLIFAFVVYTQKDRFVELVKMPGQ